MSATPQDPEPKADTPVSDPETDSPDETAADPYTWPSGAWSDGRDWS